MGKSNKKKSSKATVETYDWSIGDPAFAEWLVASGITTSTTTEAKALGLSAFWRGCSLIAGTIAGLPRRVYQDTPAGREYVPHFLSDGIAGPYDMSDFSFVETLVLHLLLHGEAFPKSIETQGGEVVGLFPVHPLAVTKVEWDGPDKEFTIALANGGEEKLISGEMTHIVGLSTDGLRGVSQLSTFRRTLGTALAGETAANKAFTNGALIAGLVTTEEDVEEPEAKDISAKLNAKMTGAENAGGLAFVNRALKFTPFAMSNKDAQFLESREFSIAEVARILGMPLPLLAVATGVSSFGTGIAELNRGLARFTLMGITGRIESALQAILPPDLHLSFDYKALLAAAPEKEIELLLAEYAAGVLTLDEVRAFLDKPPMTDEQLASLKPVAALPSLSPEPQSQTGEPNA